MLVRQYVFMGFDASWVTAMHRDAVVFVDAANQLTLCTLEEDDEADEAAAAAAATSRCSDHPNEFFDEDAAEAYDECGDVRVLVPSMKSAVPSHFEGDPLSMCAVAEGGEAGENAWALLYRSGYFHVVTVPPAVPVHSNICKQEIPKDLEAEAWAVSDTHLAVCGTMAAALEEVEVSNTNASTATTDGLLYVYVLPNLQKAVRCVNPRGERTLHCLAFSADGAFLYAANERALLRLTTATVNGNAHVPSRPSMEWARVATWEAPGIHALTCDAQFMALALCPRGSGGPVCVQLRRLSALETVVEEWEVLNDGGLPQSGSSFVSLSLKPRGLMLACGGLIQEYALPTTTPSHAVE